MIYRYSALGLAPATAKASGFLERFVVFERAVNFFEGVDGVGFGGRPALVLQVGDFPFDGGEAFFDFTGAHGSTPSVVIVAVGGFGQKQKAETAGTAYSIYSHHVFVVSHSVTPASFTFIASISA